MSNSPFNLFEATAARMNHDNHKMISGNVPDFLRSDDQTSSSSYSLLQSMVVTSIPKQNKQNNKQMQMGGSHSTLLQSSPFDTSFSYCSQQTNKFNGLNDNNNDIISTTGLHSLFGELPADAFEPVPIGKRISRSTGTTSAPATAAAAPPLNASILESVLDHALGVVQDDEPVDQLNLLATMNHNNNMNNNVRKHQAPFTPPEDIPSAPLPKRRRTSTSSSSKTNNNHQGPRFRGYQETQWMEQFQVLLGFKEEHGHCMVPHTYPENQVLSRWVKRQRYQYKLKMANKVSTMTDDRIQKLQDIGFVWDSHATAWHKRLKELKEYRQKHGDANVPSNHPESPELATWIKCQRRQYKLYWAGNKSSSMTLDRMNALNELGFIWKVREDLPLPADVSHMF